MKKIILPLPIFVLFLLMISCAYTPTIFDPSIPLEESSTVSFTGIEVLEYNGISIPPKKEYDKYTDSPWVYVALPPGEAKFVVDVNYDTSTYHTAGFAYYARNQKFKYKFEAGCYYVILFSINENEWGVKIYKYDEVLKGFLSEDKLVAFIPFEK